MVAPDPDWRALCGGNCLVQWATKSLNSVLKQQRKLAFRLTGHDMPVSLPVTNTGATFPNG
jgi:hypothetical protein